jgi:hypothetical protein
MKNKGHFKKGSDPRRHKFTRDECVRGFWNAIESVTTRRPEMVNKLGTHIARNLLPALNAKRGLKR